VVLRAIEAPGRFEQLFVLIPPITLTTMMPISIAGWGVREASMIVAFVLAQTDGTCLHSARRGLFHRGRARRTGLLSTENAAGGMEMTHATKG